VESSCLEISVSRVPKKALLLHLTFLSRSDIAGFTLILAQGAIMANPKKIVRPVDLPVRKSHSQVVTVTGGTLVFIAGMTSRSEKDAAPVHPGDMRAQLRQVCENIGRALRSVGARNSVCCAPQGRSDYRFITQEMWRKIGAVHPTLAQCVKFIDWKTYRLGRLQSEMRTEFKRSALEKEEKN
jgi:enamine deaminase RidA (YjgF/YER057c/UK114 family)